MHTQQAVEPHSSSLAEVRSRGSTAIVLFVCAAMALLDEADSQSLAIAAPLIAKALAMNSASVGLMFSCTALGGAVGYLGGGLLVDRWGPKTMVAISAVVIGVFQLATSYVRDPATLIAVRFVVGLGLAGAVPGLLIIVSQVVPHRWRYRIQGLLWACFPLGALVGGVVSGWILNHGRWQYIFVVGGVAPLIIALALWGIGPVSAQREVRGLRGVALTRAPMAGDLWVRVLLTGLVFFFTNGALAVIMNWTPSLLVRAGYAPAVGAHVFAWSAGGALISMALTGFIVERSKIAPVLAGLAASTLVTILLSVFIHSLLLITILMAVMGLVLALAGTSAVFLAGTLFPGDHQASGIGICMAIGRAGQMIFPGLIGLSLQAGASPSATLLLTAALPAAGAIAALILSLRSANAASRLVELEAKT